MDRDPFASPVDRHHRLAATLAAAHKQRDQLRTRQRLVQADVSDQLHFIEQTIEQFGHELILLQLADR